MEIPLLTPTELDGRQVMVAARVHQEADAAATLRDANRRGAVMCACCGKDGKRKNLYVSESEANIVANERRMATGITMHVYRCPYGDGWHITSNQRQW